jgi:ribosomal protein S18 acetylase RimI-like enzyme
MHDVRPIPPSMVEDAHRILVDAFDWMASRRIRQWTAAPPRDGYMRWQGQRFNYGLFARGRLAVVFSVVPARLDAWTSQPSRDGEVLWLMSLATAQAFRGLRLGERAVEAAAELSRPRDLYLECAFGEGFLPNYYAALGFEQLDRAVKHYGENGAFDMVLMRRGAGG